MGLSPRNLIIQATLKMVVKPTWCGTTLIHIITFRAFSIVFWYMMYLSQCWLMTVMVCKNILQFLNLTEEELKLKEELPLLSRTLSLQTIPNLSVNWREA